MTWDWNKTVKVLKGAGLAALGAGLAYGIAWASSVDLGVWGPTVAAILSVAANAVRQLVIANGDSVEGEP